MNSSVPVCRRIASNRLWTPAGIVSDPVVEISPAGKILRLTYSSTPDHLPFTEFYAGLLVPHFPTDYRKAFSRLLAQRERSLTELLPPLLAPDAGGGCLVVLSGLDYGRMLLTDRSQILLLAGASAR